MTGHKLRKSYKNSQELFIKKKGKGAKNTRLYENLFLSPMDISIGIFSTIFLVLSMYCLQLTTTIAKILDMWIPL